MCIIIQDPEAFVRDMRHMFDKLDPLTIRENTADVFKDMIETLRVHNVTLQNTVSTGVFSREDPFMRRCSSC